MSISYRKVRTYDADCRIIRFHNTYSILKIIKGDKSAPTLTILSSPRLAFCMRTYVPFTSDNISPDPILSTTNYVNLILFWRNFWQFLVSSYAMIRNRRWVSLDKFENIRISHETHKFRNSKFEKFDKKIRLFREKIEFPIKNFTNFEIGSSKNSTKKFEIRKIRQKNSNFEIILNCIQIGMNWWPEKWEMFIIFL